jgi:hypothetical protein
VQRQSKRACANAGIQRSRFRPQTIQRPLLGKLGEQRPVSAIKT